MQTTTATDREESDQIAWDMALEEQPLTAVGYEAVLARVLGIQQGNLVSGDEPQHHVRRR